MLCTIALLLPLTAAAQEEPQGSARQLGITPGGQYVLDGRVVSRTELRAAIQSLPADTTSWTITVDPNTPGHELSSVLALLQREGMTQFSVNVAPVAVPAPSAPAPSADPIAAPPAAAPAAPASPFSPIAEVRFALVGEDLAPDDTSENPDGPASIAFNVNRAALGVKGQLAERVEVRFLLDVVDDRDDHEYVVQDPAGEPSGSVSVPDSQQGFSVRVRDAWADLSLGAGGMAALKIGVQPPIFSAHEWVSDVNGGFYTVTPNYNGLSVVAGLHQTRAQAVSGRFAFAQDKAALSAMLSNNSGYTGGGEENTGKDVAGRLNYEVGGGLEVAVSGTYGARGAGNVGTFTGLSAALRWDSERLRVMAEYLYGAEDPDRDARRDDVPYVGGQAAGALVLPLTSPLLEEVSAVGRYGFFDPVYEPPAQEAAAWMLYSGGLLARWNSAPKTRLHTGIGAELYVPLNITLPIEYRGMAEILWAL